MHLLVYFPSRLLPGHPYGDVLSWQPEELIQEYHHDLDSLARSLSMPSHYESLVTLVLDNQDQLEDVMALAPLLEDRPLTVVLPNRDPALVGRAHQLRPRFLTFSDQEPAQLRAVLTNLAHRGHPGQASRPRNAGRLDLMS